MSDLSALSDADLEAVSKGNMSAVSDEGLQRLSGTYLPKYDPMQGLEDTLRHGAQGATFGHLPQIQAALASGRVSGPDYEAQKASARQSLADARARNPQLSFMGEIGGTAASTMAGGEAVPALIARIVKALPASARSAVIASSMRAGELPEFAKAAATAAPLGFAQNPGGDLDEVGALKERIKNAAMAGLFNGTLNKFATSAGPSAERMAFRALAPTKRDVLLARQNDNINGIGRAMLGDNTIGAEKDGVIRNYPQGKEAMYEKLVDQLDNVGAEKSDIVDTLHGRGGPQGNVDMRDVVARINNATYMDNNLPGSERWNKSVDQWTNELGRNYPNQLQISLKDADRLKTKLGKRVDWNTLNRDKADPFESQMFEKAYHILNDAVDGKAIQLANNPEFGDPDIAKRLFSAKDRYGNLKDAKSVLNKSIAAEEARQPVTQADVTTGLLGALGATATGQSPGTAVATGVALPLSYRFTKKYGMQLAAKQLDNISRLLNSKPIYNVIVGAEAGMAGAYDRFTDPTVSAWANMRTTKE